MTLHDLEPLLDDRTYDDIVRQAKALIPRYTPEWTDHNDSDPGITLIQLFAWMSEMLLYRMNRIPDLAHIKFLELLGIQLRPAEPAHAELTFTLVRDNLRPDETPIVPKGTQVIAASKDGGEPLVFEIDEALITLGAGLGAIAVFDGVSYSSALPANQAPGQWLYPFGIYAREGSALMLGFRALQPFTDAQINLAFFVPEGGINPEGMRCLPEMMDVPPQAQWVWEYWDGALWHPLSMDKDETRAFTRSGHVYLRGPGGRIRADRLAGIDQNLYWIRCRLEQSSYERSPRIEMVLTNTIAATQGITARDEVLGGSDGSPDQSFWVAGAPVIRRDPSLEVTRTDGITVTITSLRLEVDEPDIGFQAWQEVPDFYGSGPQDPHYTLNRNTGEVRFGDGKHGRVPVALNSNPSASIVAREYRYGGGKRGNAGANTITELQTVVDAVKGVTNIRPAWGGADGETLAEARLRAPIELQSRNRAVTAQDFEALAIATPGVHVKRARALPLVHPKYREAQIPGVVTVIVVPDSDSPAPLPSETTLRAVCRHLNEHRLLTSELYVVPPTYRKVKIEADIVATPHGDLAQVKHAVEDQVERYFHPLRGGRDGNGWPFGEDIFYSDVYHAVLGVADVDRIERLVIWLDDEAQEFCQDVRIETGELLYTDGHDITLSYRMRE